MRLENISLLFSITVLISTIYFFAKTKQLYEKARQNATNGNHYNYARSLIEASLDPLVTISPEGKIMDVNDATIIATGAKREELIGTDFSDYFTEPERARTGYQKVLSTGFVKGYELVLKHKSGSVMPVQYSASLYRNEIGQIQGVFAAARDISELVALKQKLETMALYDHLTELPNRRMLCDSAQIIINKAFEDKTELAVAFIDINNFKPINDVYGHPIGDKLLKWFASKLSNIVRDSDMISRYGGDEFVIIFTHAVRNRDVYQTRIKECLNDKFQFSSNGQEVFLKIDASVGIVFLSEENNKDLHVLIDLADRLMYQDKSEKKRDCETESIGEGDGH